VLQKYLYNLWKYLVDFSNASSTNSINAVSDLLPILQRQYVGLFGIGIRVVKRQGALQWPYHTKLTFTNALKREKMTFANAIAGILPCPPIPHPTS